MLNIVAVVSDYLSTFVSKDTRIEIEAFNLVRLRYPRDRRLYTWDSRLRLLDDLIHPEVFGRRLGGLRQIDSSSDADLILDKFRTYENAMRFRLTYSGQLKSAGKSSRATEKWDIRNQLHPQLEELWNIDFVLQGHGPFEHDEYSPDGHVLKNRSDFDYAARERERLRVPIVVGSYPFLPLVRGSLSLTCSLDILFLRKDKPGGLVAGGGDLDNRLKVLFDGLRMPTEDETALGRPAGEPHYCLLEDDALITDVAVRTDRLLSRPGAPASEVLLIIDVIVRASAITTGNAAFLLGPGASVL